MNDPTNQNPQAGVFELKSGYSKGCLLPTLTIVIGVTLSAYAVRHFCIEDTVFDDSKSSTNRDTFFDANRDYLDGNLDSAAAQAGNILSKQPNHAEVNQLMARISLARGNRERALEHLRRSLDTSLKRDEVSEWISTLEASQTK